MDHVAIMKKSWNLTEQIINGKKTIESRWYMMRRTPWNKIEKGDSIYFKNSGEPITIKADVEKVLQFSGLTEDTVKDLLQKYGKHIGIKPNELAQTLQRYQDKNYCILIFLKNATRITPFQINKKGYSSREAWITVEDVDALIKN